MTTEQFAAALKECLAERLVAMFLYGSQVHGDPHRQHSDANLLVVLDRCDPAVLAQGNPLLRTWLRHGNPVPVFFDLEHIRSSADVFPMEFADLMQHGKLLAGHNPFTETMIATHNLRHQCEYELKGKLLRLMSAYAICCHRPREVRALILQSASSFFAIFRGVLQLSGVPPLPTRRAVVEQLKPLVAVNCQILDALLDVREGKTVWRDADCAERFEQYLTVIRAIIRAVDIGGKSP